MARFPGTERPINDAGWLPSTPVRARRMRANGALGIADRRGFVTEVRQGHARVYFGSDVGFFWLASEALVSEPKLQFEELERLRSVHAALGGQRLNFEEDQVVIFSEAFDVAAIDTIRELLGSDLRALRLEAGGVHELAVWLDLASVP